MRSREAIEHAFQQLLDGTEKSKAPFGRGYRSGIIDALQWVIEPANGTVRDIVTLPKTEYELAVMQDKRTAGLIARAQAAIDRSRAILSPEAKAADAAQTARMEAILDELENEDEWNP